MKRIIKVKGATKRIIDPTFVAHVLGAEDTGVKLDTRRGPFSLFGLRQFLVDRLHSSGGRPKLRGTRRIRSKITFFNDDWKKLEEISRYYIKEGLNVTSSQVASALIHEGLWKIDTSRINLLLSSVGDKTVGGVAIKKRGNRQSGTDANIGNSVSGM